MPLVHKTIKVWSVQLNKTSSPYCILRPSSQAKSLSVCILHPHLPLLHLLPRPLSLWLSPPCCLCLCVIYNMCGVFCLIPSPRLTQPLNPHPPDTCQSVPCISWLLRECYFTGIIKYVYFGKLNPLPTSCCIQLAASELLTGLTLSSQKYFICPHLP